jgi:superfamily II DNA or RNA helicase
VARVVLDNRVRLSLDEISSGARARLVEAFTHQNPAYGKSRNPDELPQYETWVAAGGEISVPRGGLQRVLNILAAEGHFADVVDETTWDYPEPGIPDHLVKLRGYQGDMLSSAEAARTCALRAPTGSGKTTAGIGFVARQKRRSLVIVWTAGLLKQWVERAVQELGIAERDVGVIRGPKTKIRPVTVGMQQSILARFDAGDDDLAGAFDIVLVDELQRFAAPTLYRTIDPFTARMRVGISANETRRDEKQFLIYDLFGDVAKSVREDDLIASGDVVDVELAVVPTEFHAPWYRFRQDFTRLVDEMVSDEARNRRILRLAARTVGEGHQVLVFTHRVEHAREIDRRLVELGIPSGLLLGGVENEPEFDRTKSGIKRGTTRAACGTYQSIAQAIDMPSVARGIAATPIAAANHQQLNQVKGRLCRPSDGKGFGRLAVMWDRHVYGRKAIENFVRYHRTVRVWDAASRQWVDGALFLQVLRERRSAVRV